MGIARTWFGVTAAVIGLVWPLSASAQLSQVISLTEVLARTRQSPQIALIARLELKRAKLRRDDVTCLAQIHDRQWEKLKGTPIGPYECSFGGHVLVLIGRAEYLDAGGQKLKPTDPALKAKAVRVSERKFRWRWKKMPASQTYK